MIGATPVDIGRIDYEDYDERADQHLMDEDVGAVSLSTQCYGCGSWEICAEYVKTAKGKGKGSDEGKGKGTVSYPYRNEQNQSSRKTCYEASTKGFKASCFKCRQFGHRAADCQPNAADSVEEIADADDEVPLGGVWVRVDVQRNTRSCHSE